MCDLTPIKLKLRLFLNVHPMSLKVMGLYLLSSHLPGQDVNTINVYTLVRYYYNKLVKDGYSIPVIITNKNNICQKVKFRALLLSRMWYLFFSLHRSPKILFIWFFKQWLASCRAPILVINLIYDNQTKYFPSWLVWTFLN